MQMLVLQFDKWQIMQNDAIVCVGGGRVPFLKRNCTLWLWTHYCSNQRSLFKQHAAVTEISALFSSLRRTFCNATPPSKKKKNSTTTHTPSQPSATFLHFPSLSHENRYQDFTNFNNVRIVLRISSIFLGEADQLQPHIIYLSIFSY